MAEPLIIRDAFWEGSPNFPRAQWPNENGTLWAITDFTNAVTLRAYDLSSSNTTTPVFSNTRARSAVLTNTPASWGLDGTGYNFHDTVLISEVPFEGGHTYRISYAATRTDGNGVEYLVFEGRAEPNSPV